MQEPEQVLFGQGRQATQDSLAHVLALVQLIHHGAAEALDVAGQVHGEKLVGKEIKNSPTFLNCHSFPGKGS